MERSEGLYQANDDKKIISHFLKEKMLLKKKLRENKARIFVFNNFFRNHC